MSLALVKSLKVKLKKKRMSDVSGVGRNTLKISWTVRICNKAFERISLVITCQKTFCFVTKLSTTKKKHIEYHRMGRSVVSPKKPKNLMI